MDIKVKPGQDTVAIIEEPNAMVFATRKEWHELPEVSWNELSNFDIKMVFKGTSAVFFLIRNFLPMETFDDRKHDYRIIKITTDENKKFRLYYMDLSTAEGQQILRNRFNLWD